MLKNKYKNDFQKTSRMDAKGRMVQDSIYIGDIYVLPFDEKKKKQTNRVTLGFAAAMVAIQLLAGMMNQDSSRTFWIVYPYLFIFLPTAYMLIGAISYTEATTRMQRPQFDGSIRRMHRSAIGALVICSISAVCDMIYIIMNHSSMHMGREIMYLICHIVFIAVGVCYGKYYDHIFSGIQIENGNSF